LGVFLPYKNPPGYRNYQTIRTSLIFDCRWGPRIGPQLRQNQRIKYHLNHPTPSHSKMKSEQSKYRDNPGIILVNIEHCVYYTTRVQYYAMLRCLGPSRLDTNTAMTIRPYKPRDSARLALLTAVRNRVDRASPCTPEGYYTAHVACSDSVAAPD
jgi:hypothetical protein